MTLPVAQNVSVWSGFNCMSALAVNSLHSCFWNKESEAEIIIVMTCIHQITCDEGVVNGQEVLTGSFPTLFTLVHTYSSEQRRKKRLVQCNESVSRYIWKRKTNLGLKSTEVIVPKVGQWLNMLKKWSLALYICIFSHKMLSNFSHTSLKTTPLFVFLIVLFLDY